MFTRFRLGYRVLLALAAMQFVLAFGLGTAPLAKYLEAGGFVYSMLPVWLLLPWLWLGYVALRLARRGVERPAVALRKVLYRDRHWLFRGTLLMLIVLLLARAFTSYKTAIPHYAPFYADPYFIAWDRILFGTDPWRLTHWLIGPAGTIAIDFVYGLWFPIIMLYVGWFCFTRNQQLQLRGLLTYFGAWGLLGNGLATAAASVGPCFYERFYGDSHFAPLMETLAAKAGDNMLLSRKAMDWLIASIGEDRFGAGISAMPSMHVAIAFLCWLVVWEYGRHRIAKQLGFAFFAVILIGSVHLGWHYAADGLISVIGVGAIWWASGRFMRWLERRELGQDAVHANEPRLASVA